MESGKRKREEKKINPLFSKISMGKISSEKRRPQELQCVVTHNLNRPGIDKHGHNQKTNTYGGLRPVILFRNTYYKHTPSKLEKMSA